MKKNINLRSIFFIFILILLFSQCIFAYAEPLDNVSNDIASGEMTRLYRYITEMKNDYDVLKDLDPKVYVDNFMRKGESGVTFKNIITYLLKYFSKEINQSKSFIGSLIILSILCALLKNLGDAFEDDNISNVAFYACYALIIVILAKSFYIGIDLAKDTIFRLTDFMAALMPVLMTLLASVGGFTQATLMDPIILGVTNISARIFVDFIIPLTIFGFVLMFVNNLSKDYKVGGLANLLNKVALWAEGIVMTLFVGIVSVRSIATKTIDQVTMKTAKFAVDNFIPIVGKCLSDAISSVAGYSLLIKNAIGSLGLIIVLIIVLIPIIKLAIIAFMYKVCAALIEPISDSRIVKCIDSAGSSIILIMSYVICISIMCFIMVAIIASTGRAVVY